MIRGRMWASSLASSLAYGSLSYSSSSSSPGQVSRSEGASGRTDLLPERPGTRCISGAFDALWRTEASSPSPSPPRPFVQLLRFVVIAAKQKRPGERTRGGHVTGEAANPRLPERAVAPLHVNVTFGDGFALKTTWNLLLTNKHNRRFSVEKQKHKQKLKVRDPKDTHTC